MWRSHECPRDECGRATNAGGECCEATNARRANVQARMLRSCECLRLMCKHFSYVAEKCLKSLNGNAF